MVSKKEVKKRGVSVSTNLPEGVSVLWNYICIMLFLFLFILFLFDFSIFFGFVLEGTPANLFHLFYFIVFFVVLFGITYHKPWTHKFLLWMFYYWSANIFVTFIVSSFIENLLAKSYLVLFSPVMLLLFVVNLIIIWYLREKKENFIQPTRGDDMVEKVFKHIMLLVFLSVIFLLVFGILKMAQIPIGKEYIEKQNDSLDNNEANFCENTDKYQNICYLLKAKVYCENETCLKIEDSFYRFLCMKVVGTYEK